MSIASGHEVTLLVREPADRLDRYLAAQLDGLSRSAVQGLIRRDLVLVNGSGTRASQALAPGDRVQVWVPRKRRDEIAPESLPIDVLHEDAHIIVVSKAAGMLVHPGAGELSGTLVNALLARWPSIMDAFPGDRRPGIVHRLDRDTSGALVVAKSDAVRQALQEQFRARTVVKSYVAVVHGWPEPDRAAIDAPIGRDPAHRQRMAVLRNGGRRALTEYVLRERLRQASWLDVRLHTGRTHQIRVHMAAIGHPVVGDVVYGPRRASIQAPRQMLHSHRLGFRHPATGTEVQFSAPVPADMLDVVDRLRPST